MLLFNFSNAPKLYTAFTQSLTHFTLNLSDGDRSVGNYLIMLLGFAILLVASAAAAVGVEVVDIDMAAAGAAFPHISRVRKIYLPLSRLSVLNCKYTHIHTHTNTCKHTKARE